MFLRRFLGLHLQASTHSIERVCCTGSDRNGGLSCRKCGDCAHDALVGFVRVQCCDSIEASELKTTIANYADDRDTETSVEGEETARSLHGLDDAITETRKTFLSRSDIRSQASSRVVERIHDAEATCCSRTT